MTMPALIHGVCLLLLCTTISRGDEVSILQGQLDSPLVENRRAAADRLARLGEQSLPALEDLLVTLQDKDDMVRGLSAWAVGATGSKEPKVVTALITALDDPHLPVRFNAALGLTWIGEPAQKPLLEAIPQMELPGQAHAVQAILKIDPATAVVAVQPTVLQFLSSDNDEVLRQGLLLLSQTDAWPTPPVDVVGEKLLHADPEIRILALSTVDTWGEKASKLKPQVIALSATDPDWNVRAEAADALAHLGYSEETLSALIVAMGDDKGRVRATAAYAASGYGSKAVPTLLEALESDDLATRQSILDSFAYMKVEAAGAVATLIALLDDPDYRIRLGAISALGWIGKRTPAVESAIEKALADKDVSVQAHARQAIANLEQAEADNS